MTAVQLSLIPPTAVRLMRSLLKRAPEAETMTCIDCDGGQWAVVVVKGADGIGEALCAKHAERRR